MNSSALIRLLIALVIPINAASADAGLVTNAEINQLYRQARLEKQVTLYSVTSRVYLLERLFEQRYPGIDLIPFVLSSREQIMRFQAERRADLDGADVLYLNDAPAVLDLVENQKTLTSYIPDRIKTRIPQEYQSPLLYHRLSTKVLLYNQQTYPTAPVTNLWALTQPQWQGKVIMVDPASRQDYLDLLASFVLHSRQLADAYIEFFAREPILENGVTTVGEKYIRDLFGNDLILVANTERLNAAIGKTGQTLPPVGFGTYSDVRHNRQRGWAIQVANQVNPSSGVIYPVVLAVNRFSGHPAASRLLVDFMLGDDSKNGGEALAPFIQPGDYLTRTDLSIETMALPREDLNAWTIEPDKIRPLRQQVFDLVLELAAQ